MKIGLVAPRDLDDEQLVPLARRAEGLGFDLLWVVEDLGFKGGFTQAATVLASTERLHVGIGILPVAARHPVFTAMEAATLARTHPGRSTLGLGHGMPVWMRQVGAQVESPLTLLTETLDVVRRLLAGETVTTSGRYVHLDGVRLEAAPAVPPPVVAGVRGPQSLAVSGEHADGTLLAEPVTVPYLQRARELTGRGSVPRDADTAAHALHVYNLGYVDDDPAVAREHVREAVAVFGEPDWWPHVAPLPFASDFRALAERTGSADELAAALPDEWIDALAVVGTPATVRARVDALAAAGAASCSFFVPGEVGQDQLARLARASTGNRPGEGETTERSPS